MEEGEGVGIVWTGILGLRGWAVMCWRMGGRAGLLLEDQVELDELCFGLAGVCQQNRTCVCGNAVLFSRLVLRGAFLQGEPTRWVFP